MNLYEKLNFAREIGAAKVARKPLSDESKRRQREASKAWKAKRRAENLAQRELIRSREPLPI